MGQSQTQHLDRWANDRPNIWTGGPMTDPTPGQVDQSEAITDPTPGQVAPSQVPQSARNVIVKIVNSRLLQRPQKRIRGNQIIHRRLTRTKSIVSGSRSK